MDQEILLADYLPFVEIVDAALNMELASLPVCRDQYDQMFLVLAQASKADFLVTGDQDLLVLTNTPDLPFRILKPVEFLMQHQLMPQTKYLICNSRKSSS